MLEQALQRAFRSYSLVTAFAFKVWNLEMPDAFGVVFSY